MTSGWVSGMSPCRQGSLSNDTKNKFNHHQVGGGMGERSAGARRAAGGAARANYYSFVSLLRPDWTSFNNSKSSGAAPVFLTDFLHNFAGLTFNRLVGPFVDEQVAALRWRRLYVPTNSAGMLLTNEIFTPQSQQRASWSQQVSTVASLTSWSSGFTSHIRNTTPVLNLCLFVHENKYFCISALVFFKHQK